MEFMERKLELIKSFNNTINIINHSDRLQQSIIRSIEKTRIYEYIDIGTVINSCTKDGSIEVIDGRTINQVFDYKDRHVAILNFASAKHPGGKVLDGSNAQEESICRCSTLYPVIANRAFHHEFYGYHKSNMDKYPYYTDKILYSKGIMAIKKDAEIPIELPEEDWCSCDVITCAAPNLIYNKPDNEALINILFSRIKNIIKVAAYNHVDVLILGSWGCGVFRNPPEIVAKCFKVALNQLGYRKCFDKVIFAVINDHRGNNNYQVFKDVLG